MLPDLKSQWAALFPFANGVGELVAVLRDMYSLLDRIFGQSEGSRALWVTLMATVVTVAALLHPHAADRIRRRLEFSAHLALQIIMVVLVGGPWLVFPILNHCVIHGHFRVLSVTLVATAVVSGWGNHCDPEGKTLTTTVTAWVGLVRVDVRAFWCGLVTFTLMFVAVVGTFM